MEVGLGAVAGVPTQRDRNACADWLPGLHSHAAALQVRQQHERTVGANGDHHVIAGQTRSSTLGSSRLSQHVRHQAGLTSDS